MRSRSPQEYPVIEVFGPTIQGEGPHAGEVVSFVRFGGCDFRCEWCDSMYAVEPAEVKATAEHLTAAEIVARLPEGTDTVILSGGNPALQHGEELAEALFNAEVDFHVETQGTVWRDWLVEARLVVVSPKPPSSGMDAMSKLQAPQFFKKHELCGCGDALALKVVVADETDLAWALDLRDTIDPARAAVPFYLSALTPPDATLDQVAASYRNLCDLVLADPTAKAHRPTVLPQLHVIAWGHERGV